MEVSNSVSESECNISSSGTIFGWLYEAKINESGGKLNTEDVRWNLKAITFTRDSKQLVIHSRRGSTSKSDAKESASRRESVDTNDGSSHSLHSRQPSFTRQDTDDSQSGSLKQFISRKWSRSRSVGKVGQFKQSESSVSNVDFEQVNVSWVTLKINFSSPKSNTNHTFGTWRSVDSDTSLEDEGLLYKIMFAFFLKTSISENLDDLKLNDTIINFGDREVVAAVRPVHYSIYNRSSCFQIVMLDQVKTFSCCNEEDHDMWLSELKGALKSDQDERTRLDTSLSVWIIEAKSLPSKKHYYCELLLDNILQARTAVKYKEELLFWGESFVFNDMEAVEYIKVNLYCEGDSKRKKKQDKNILQGSCVVDLLNIETNVEVEDWINFKIPRGSPKIDGRASVVSKNESPVVRIKVKYDTTVILPLDSYTELLEYLQKNYLKLTNILEPVISTKNKDFIAKTLLKIFCGSGICEQFLVDIIMNEVRKTTDQNLTFRGNSLATKSVDAFMKMIGLSYLRKTIGATIETIYKCSVDPEIDPQRMTSENTLEENQKNILKFVEDIWGAVSTSYSYIPDNLKSVFCKVRKECEGKSDTLILERLVSSFFFLRFICPAILSPSLFKLTQKYPNEKVARCLTLVAKVIQNLANFSRFGGKEQYMDAFNEFVEAEIPTMRNFLSAIASDNMTDKSKKQDTLQKKCNIEVDLGKELSRIYLLLGNEYENLSKESQEDLNDLKMILERIQLMYHKSPSANDLRIRNSNISSSFSDSFSYHPDMKVIENSNLMNTGPYEDCLLSVATEYVSGCSLVTQSLSKQNSKARAIGRSELQRNKSLNQKENIPKKNPRNRSISVQHNTQQKVISPKRSVPEKTNLAIFSKKDSVKDRISMFSQKSRSASPISNKLPPSSFTQTRSKNTYTVGTPEASDTNEIKGPQFTNRTKTHLQRFHGHFRNGEDEINAMKPIDDSNNNMKSDKSWIKDKNNRPSIKNRSSSTSQTGRISTVTNSRFTRSQLKTDTLKRENKFSHSHQNRGSLNDLVNNQILSNKNNSNQIEQGSRKQSTLDRPSLFENNVEKLDKNITKADNEHIATNVYTSKEVIANFTDGNDLSDFSLPDRGQSALSYNSVENSYDTYVYEQNNNRCYNNYNTIAWDCGSSDCSYSSDCYSSEGSIGICIEGDNLADILNGTNNIEVDQRMDTELSSHQDMEVNESLSEKHLKQKIIFLQDCLKERNNLVRLLERELHEKTNHFQTTVVTLKEKLIEADRKMKLHQTEADCQMKSVINRLVNVETELRREQTEMEAVIKGKQKIIDIQNARIQSLESANKKLINVLTQIQGKFSKSENQVSELDLIKSVLE